MKSHRIERGMLLIGIIGLLMLTPALGEERDATESAAPSQSLEDETQALKQEMLDINRELFMIEEDILYPQSTQITVFISMDTGEFFELDSVQLRVDDKIVANYLFTEREVAALRKGAVQRLYQGNLRAGKHELLAYFIGKGPHDRAYKRGAKLTIDKQPSPQFVELKIIDNAGAQQPEFEVKSWE